MSRNSSQLAIRRGSSSGPLPARPTKPAIRVSATVIGAPRVSSVAAYTPGGFMSRTALIGSPCRPRDPQHRSGWHPAVSSSFTRLVDLLVDPGDLTQPDMSLVVFHVEHVVERPVEVVRNVG